MRIILEDILTVTMNERGEIENLTIIIDNGKIQSLVKGKVKKTRGAYLIPGKNKIAIPGLINGHIHSDIALARGLGDGLSLYEQDYDSFVSRKRWFREELDQESRYYSRLLQYSEAVKGGTTFICDVPFWSYGDDLITPFKEVGIEGAVVLDFRKDFLNGEPIAKENYFKTARSLKDHGYIPIVEGPAEENYEKGLLKSLMSWAEELDTLLQMHLAETRWRKIKVLESFKTTPVRFLREIGFLNERVMGTHGVYIDREEMVMLKDAGSRIVNCPTSEMKIADGIAPVVQLIENQIPLGLGTDGALWNDSSDMFSEMKNLLLLQRVSQGANVMDAKTCFHAATLGGAKVFNLEKEIGSIEEGKRAHIVMIDYLKPHLTPIYHGDNSNILQVLTSCARASDIDTVIIDGRIVVERGNLKTLDEKGLLNQCQERAEKRFKNMEKLWK